MVQMYLQKEFEKRAAHNPKYSLRAFARDLQIHSGTLSSILNQRRPVGSKVLAHLMKVLPLSKVEKKTILSNLILSSTPGSMPPVLLTEDVLAVLRDWEHFAILAYFHLPQCKFTAGGIAQDLNISQSRALRALSNLESAGLIQRKGIRFVSIYKDTITSQGVPSPALREAHRQYLEKALYSIENTPVENRDISGTTMAVSRANLPKAIEIIKQFRKDIAECLECGSPDDVYRLNVQLFPLTKINQKEKAK